MNLFPVFPNGYFYMKIHVAGFAWGEEEVTEDLATEDPPTCLAIVVWNGEEVGALGKATSLSGSSASDLYNV